MFPRGALLYLTNACNLNCRHCGIVENVNPCYLSKENFDKTLELLKDKKCYIVAISGGDPILHNNCFEFINKIRKSGMLPVLGISGTGLNDEIIETIRNANVGCVQVSLDGTTEYENSFFRDKGSFNEIITNIKKMQKKEIKVNIAVCFSKENVHILENMLIFLKSLNAYQIKIQFWKATSKNNNFNQLTREEKIKVFRKVKEFIQKNALYGWANIDIDFLEKEVNSKKFILYPDGKVYYREDGECIGSIINDYERIKDYYER